MMRRAAGILLSLPVLAGVALAGYWAGTRRGVSHDRPKASRLLAGAAALLLVATAISCSPSHSGTPTAPGSGTASTRAAIWTPPPVVIPTGGLDSFVQCMVNAGYKITYYNAQASPLQYELSGPEMNPELHARVEQCQALQPSTSWPSDDEIRQIYSRWVGEYNCLIGLGYQPDPPPSVETFTADYTMSNGHGPWGPIDGTGWEGWSQAQYDQAKAKCTIEMLPDAPEQR
jgi:hypothetical protein